MRFVRLRSLPWWLALGAVVIAGLFFFVNGRSYLERQAAVRKSLAAREAMAETLSLLKDAETGVRGFLLTDDDGFLDPYEVALPKLSQDLDVLRRFGDAEPAEHARAHRAIDLVHQKLAVLSYLIARRREHDLSPREAVPLLEQGKAVMDATRVEVAEMIAGSDQRLAQREQAMAAVTLRLQLLLGTALFGGIALALVGLSSARTDATQAQLTSEELARELEARERAEQKFRDQTRLLESVLTNIGDAVIVLDADRNVLIMNPAAERMVPYRVGATLSKEWSTQVVTRLPDGKTLFPPEKGPMTRALQGFASDDVEMLIVVPTGESRSYSVTTRPMSRGGATVGAVAVFRDWTDLRRATKELVENEQRYKILSEASFEGVAITKEGKIQDSNPNFAHWLGYEPADLVGMTGIELFPEDERARVRELSTEDEVGYEARMLRRDGSTFPVEVRGRFAKFHNDVVRLAVIRDITEKKQREAELLEKTEQLRALSLRDELTGLYNRRGFMEIAEHHLKTDQRARKPCAVFFADLNGLKLINDQLGHEMGDRAIREAARVLESVFRASDVVARLGGDEFAIFASECDDLGVVAAAMRLERAVSDLNDTSTNRYRLSVSVGAAVLHADEPRDLAALMQAADQNMYDVKRARHQRFSLRVRPG
jgi:diguanylate cyclase (GGDEF)-like protein/PAS domain S-box-containing protein